MPGPIARLDKLMTEWSFRWGLQLDEPPTEEELEAAEVYASAQTYGVGRTIAGLMLGGLGAWMIVDYLSFGAGNPQANALLRIRLSVMTCCALLLLAGPLAKRAPRLALAALLVSSFGATIWSLAPLGLESPMVHMGHWLFFTTLLVVCPLANRILLCGAGLLAMWLGLIIAMPDPLSHPMHAPFVSTAAGVAMMAVFGGHFLSVILASLYAARERLQRQGEILEQRVLEATSRAEGAPRERGRRENRGAAMDRARDPRRAGAAGDRHALDASGLPRRRR